MDPQQTAYLSKSPQISNSASERIRIALGLDSVDLTGIPEETIERLAEISEKTLCRYPRKLNSISGDRKRWGGSYFLELRHFRINPKMSPTDTVQVFVHEFGHAVQFAICETEVGKASYLRKVTSIREANVRLLVGIYFKAAQQVPALKDIFLKHKYANLTSVRDMYDRLKKDEQLIPHAIFEEFNTNLFSRYSLKNVNEYFCEMFSAYVIESSPTEYARCVGKIVEDVTV